MIIVEQRFLSKISTEQFTSKQEANSKGSQKLSDSINGINQVHKIDNGEGNDEDSAKIEDLEKRVPLPTSISIVNYSKFHGEDHSTVIISPDKKEQQYIPQKIHFKYSKKELGESLAYYFLPNGYPHSVNTGYLKFSLLFGLSAFSITCLSFISTQCLFVALGSTTTKASLYSAAYTWVLKDGIGQLGAILFAGKYGKNFDEDVKKWRFMWMIIK